ADAFERIYPTRWLTELKAQLEAWQERSLSLTPNPPLVQFNTPSSTSTGIQPLSESESDLLIDTDMFIQRAASLLTVCAAAAGKVYCQFSPRPARGKIHIELMDIPLDNHNCGNVRAQTLVGCILVIAGVPIDSVPTGMHWNPSASRNTLNTWEDPLHFLELGAGTGSVRLTVARLLQALHLCKKPKSKPTLSSSSDDRPQIFYPSPDGNDTDYIGTQIHVNTHALDWLSLSVMTETLPILDALMTSFNVVWDRHCLRSSACRWICNYPNSLLSYWLERRFSVSPCESLCDQCFFC
ncbi:hypothetical protein J3R83DRAFT_9856, partial [Lanmaoa asiatica]